MYLDADPERLQGVGTPYLIEKFLIFVCKIDKNGEYVLAPLFPE